MQYLRSKSFSYDTFYLPAKVPPLKIALGETLLSLINSHGGLEHECPGWNIFEKSISGETSIGHPRIGHKSSKIKKELKVDSI